MDETRIDRGWHALVAQPREHVRCLAFSIALLCAGSMWAAENSSPRIADCRIGFDGAFKVGHWTPIWLAASGDVASTRPTVEVTTTDSEGVAMTVAKPVPMEGGSVEGCRPVLLYTKVGRIGSDVVVTLVGEDKQVLDRTSLSSQRGELDGSRYSPLASTDELVVQVGSASLGVTEAFPAGEAADGAPVRRVVQLADVDAMPTNWFGYDAVDVLVLATADAQSCERLAADKPRMEALRNWLELGGRLVVCGGRAAPSLLAEGKAFAEFLPGTLVDVVRLPQTQGLEIFAGGGEPLGQGVGQRNVPVPHLVEFQGRVEVFGRGNDLPLVVRSARGLGELVFVGLDLDEPPLAEWRGRNAFWQAVLGPYLSDTEARSTQTLVSRGYDDLAGALRQRLGRRFAGVTAIGLPIVAALGIGYLLLLGPLDYFFVHKLVRRPWVAWVTLPLVVFGTTLGAMALMGAAKGGGSARVNSAELVDFDLTTGRARGISWAALYSPQARRYDVTIEPRQSDGRPDENAQTLVSTLGLPGAGLSGMHAAGDPIDVAGVGYRLTHELSELDGLPVLTSSTRSLLAQWDSKRSRNTRPPFIAELSVDADGLVAGVLTNETGSRLRDACLLHGRWGYRLGDLEPGERSEVGPERSAIQVKTIVARRARQIASSRAADVEHDLFLADRATPDELLNVMMFYQVVGGNGFAGLPNRFQAECDLSRLLDLDRAILVANGTDRGSRWVDAQANKPFENEQDSATVVYRFVFPVSK
jgi:hypothetical protein